MGLLRAQSCREGAPARLFNEVKRRPTAGGDRGPAGAQKAHTRPATSPGARTRAGALARASFLWLTWRVKDRS